MSNAQAEEHFQKGLHALTNGHTHLALVCFQHAKNLDPSPKNCSYLGYCLAKTRGNFQDAIAFCQGAVEGDPKNSTLYLNLGRVFAMAGQREKALETLRLGLQQDGSEEIMEELLEMGTRRAPPFSSLKRSNPLNRYVGILLKRLGIR
jgi:tetratricopeptide (TPR) repeat protein